MELKVYTLEEISKKIENEILNSFPQEEPANLYEPIKYIMFSKGKRLRPLLSILACGMVSNEIENAIKPAVAFELLHNFTLIHDDIMDQSPTRRGRATVHKKWNEAIAILAGDLLLALAYRKISESLPNDIHSKVIQTFNDSFVEVCEGQGYDMDFEDKKDIIPVDYFKMIDKKTAKLLEKAIVAGGQIGGANEDQLSALSSVGYNLGLGFQLQDDLLDLTADNEKFGKAIGKDLVEGKKTLIILKAKEMFNDTPDINLLNKFYAENGLQGSDVIKMIEALHKNGVFDIIKKEISYYFQSIKSSLKIFEENHYKELFTQVLNFTFSRDY
ncbi:MAG: hypothetical protein A2X64_02625 [Ignavibacteria bacterium GWF2_33_9]|nr:MAG: hypothetical protein A2X64_02625 [Ignavibacteria bacterium GWF2_33_9]